MKVLHLNLNYVFTIEYYQLHATTRPWANLLYEMGLPEEFSALSHVGKWKGCVHNRHKEVEHIVAMKGVAIVWESIMPTVIQNYFSN